PSLLTQLGIGLEQVRAGLRSVNANAPKGQLTDAATSWTIQATDQLFDADEYRPVIVAWQNGAPVRLGDIASVESSVEDLRTAGLANGKRAVLLVVFRQPGTNIIETVDRVTALMPELRASIPPAIDISVVLDRTTTIRASFRDIQLTLLLSIALVVLVVFLFLRKGSATTIPSVAVPLSLLGTFGGMYLLVYSLDNLSLMALTISSGFVVDDDIVVPKPIPPGGHGRLYRLSERAFTLLLSAYAATLGWVLRHQRVTLLVMLVTIGLNIYLFAIVPKGFFPQQDSGRIIGSIQASQDISF